LSDVEPQELFLGFREGAVEDHGLAIGLAQGLGLIGVLEAYDRAERAAGAERLLHLAEARHAGGVFLLGPGGNRLFVIVAQNGIKHAAPHSPEAALCATLRQNPVT